MPPVVKYTLARIVLFLLVLLALWPVNLNGYLKLILAVAFSAALSFFLLRGVREEAAEKWVESSRRRQEEKERLRATLAGEEPVAPPSGPGGADRGTAPGGADGPGEPPASR